MLPSILSREIKEGIARFLQSTFPPSTPCFDGALDALLNAAGAVFKGPYYSLRLPFQCAKEARLPFALVSFPFRRPHHHQALAFERLCGDAPGSTLIATGTGSGKTECFLYPILDHCARNPARKGIKAIVIYPMNALATDQAKRFARAVHNDPALKGKIRVGMYVGGEGDESTDMAEAWPITSRHAMRKEPPDILLTNYKMLDYLLIRPDDLGLWADNDPETLKFIAVDELHTFDGAQATDLACLLRRLKRRLKTPAAHLCCVGTSATVGGEESAEGLITYAETLFGESFEGSGAIIREHVLDQAAFTSGFYIRYTHVPGREAESILRPAAWQDLTAYLKAQYALWFEEEAPEDIDEMEWRTNLGDKLREHSLLRNLLLFFERHGKPQVAEPDLIQELALINRDLQEKDLAYQVLDSLNSLCAHARYRNPETGTVTPFLKIHVYLWLRELTRMVATVDAKPRLAFSADLKKDDLSRCLPVVHCRDCGTMGWGGTMRANESRVNPGLDDFYHAWFGREVKLRLLMPLDHHPDTPQAHDSLIHQSVCGRCLQMHDGHPAKCNACGEANQIVPVELHARTLKRLNHNVADVSCPSCQSPTGLTIMGSRSASLTSVALGQLFATPFNDDKQALAFSDNVQDASHRASFFAARTFRTTLRTAICKVLRHAEHGINLSDFAERFIGHWTKHLSREDFVGTFLAPNMEWKEDYEALRRELVLPKDTRLHELVAKRLRWEILAEFGYQARIGRTLEKSGAAIAFIPPAELLAPAETACTRLREHQGGFGSVSQEDMLVFMLGLLHRLRVAGGYLDSTLESYIKERGNTYLLNKLDWTPGFGRVGRAPTFFISGSAAGRFERVVGTGTSPSALQRWAMQTIRIPGGMTRDTATPVIEAALAALTQAGLLGEVVLQDELRVWGLIQDRVRIDSEVVQLGCDGCGHSVSTAAAEAAQWAGIPCLREVCGGHYAAKDPGPSYFADLYRSGDVSRIHAAEHTGLIKRDEREWIERRFMTLPSERTATDPNLLSCTPTLEMGIDISDLSSVVLCSVPPETANYIQRAGRAGRRDGNAFSLTVANAQPHDLYFYAQPEEMMSGEVRVPGVFLNAPAVLERQFIAFSLDRWIESSSPPPTYPRIVEPALKNVLAPSNPPVGFPFDLLDFIQLHTGSLLKEFISLFQSEGEGLELAAIESIERFARGNREKEGSLAWKILTRFRESAREWEDLKKRRAQMRDRIRKIEALSVRDEETEEELDELRKTANGLASIIREIGGKSTLNFFTDEGLLPNYAFPEQGVTLRSIILRKKERHSDGEGGSYDSLTLEYQRPAASAIRELAPGNNFYAQGRRLTVDQVNLRLSDLEWWNFCDECCHIERITEGVQAGQCPCCASPNWADTSLRRQMLRMRQLITTEFDRSSRTQDDSDERNPVFYSEQMSVHIPAEEIQKAYEVTGGTLPFGFEYIRLATFREVNLGREDATAQKVKIGGTERSGVGFRLCPKCGKVQGARPEGKELKHDIACPYRKRPDATTPLEAVFLYRELSSEALRILVPSVSAKESEEMSSFVAALELGLLDYFRGDITHLASCTDSTPIPGTSFSRTYLVVYDRVPGGTGYLKELASSPDKLLDVLARSYATLRKCACAATPDADGCHRCILRNQRRKGAMPSRSVALAILEKILSQRDQLREIRGLSAIDINPLLESKLERMFLEALGDTEGFTLQTEVIESRSGYRLTAGKTVWEVVPQWDVNASPVVPLACRPDCMLRPVRRDFSLPIAVFLDGFAFHADEANGKNRIGDDIAKRQGLIHSRAWLTWSLTWDDLVSKPQDATQLRHPAREELAVGRARQLLAHLVDKETAESIQHSHGDSPWHSLVAYLSQPETLNRRMHAFAVAASITQLQPAPADAILEALETMLSPIGQLCNPLPKTADASKLGFLSDPGPDSRWRILCELPKEAVTSRDPSGLRVLIRFNDHLNLDADCLAPDWKGLLSLHNQLQFLPGSFFVTHRSLGSGASNGIDEAWFDHAAANHPTPPVTVPAEPSDSSDVWLPDASLVHADALPLYAAICAADLTSPVLGYELFSPSGIILATAELAWEESKLAVFTHDQADDLPHFKQSAWLCILMDDSSDLAVILEQINTHLTP
ncbi:MAG: DEAD/DEAH box helicase [Verrucomicrobia bacterium]|nr:DEAD/DEAH box helicase [Verrucomicrobiota bacterium]